MDRELILFLAEFLVRLIAIVAVPFVIKFIKKYRLEKAIKNAVYAAEQILKKDDPNGHKRKAFVRKYILDRFKISEEELNVLLESFVKELNIEQLKAVKGLD